MKTRIGFFSTLVLASTLAFLTACGGGSKEQPQTTQAPATTMAPAATSTTDQMLQSMQMQINNLQQQVNQLQQQILQLQSQ